MDIVGALGAWGPIVMIVIIVLCGLVCLPLTPAVVAAGVLFGRPEGLLVAALAVTISGLTNFVVARHMWRGQIERRLRKHATMARLDAALGRDGAKVLALLRLSPIVPWAPVSYAAGLSRMRGRTYAATCLAMLPLAMLYTWLGAVAGEVGLHRWQRIADDVEPWAVPIGTLFLAFAAIVFIHIVSRSRIATLWPGKDVR